MAWRAFLSTINQVATTISFEVIYSDGTRKVLRHYNVERIDDATIKNTARNEIALLDGADQKATPLTVAIGDEIDVTLPLPTPTPPASPTEILRDVFLTDWNQFRHYQSAVGAGLIDAADKRVVDLRNKLKAEWLDEYVVFL